MGPFKYYVIKEVGGRGGQMMMFDDKVDGCWWLKSVHFQKPVTRSSFLSKSVVIFNITTTNMTTLFERNEDRITGFLK